jgi:23S rRNA (guanosine2251-2'-O)-methyltransferase
LKRQDTLLFGFHPAREALRQRPHEVLELQVASRRRGNPRGRELEDLARRHRVPVRDVTERELDAACGGPEHRATHNGVAVLVRTEQRGTEQQGTARSGPPSDADLVVLLEDIQDPRNLGALLRVCEGAGVGRVLVRDRGSAPIGATAVKASAGASEWLEVERVSNAPNAILELRNEGYWVYGADTEGEPPWRIDLRGKVALCFGGEQKGLRRLTRERCDGLLGLPMRGHVESLNVATAAAAILYEAVRQRTEAGSQTPPGGRERLSRDAEEDG